MLSSSSPIEDFGDLATGSRNPQTQTQYHTQPLHLKISVNHQFMSQIRQISECFIRPQFEPDQSKRQFHLGALHISMLPMGYMRCGFVFRKPCSYSALSHLERLQHSLSQALVHFYPLAGQLETQRFENEHSSCIYVDCRKGPGARLIHAAASNVTVHDVVYPNSDVPKLVHNFFDLGDRRVNYDGHTRPLLSVQVTELADGVFLGYSANHSVVDGTSFFHFHKVWSDIFMGLSQPINQKPGFRDGQMIIRLLPRQQIFKLPFLEPSEFIIRFSEVQISERFFHFSKTCVQNLKAKANAEAAANLSPPARISSFMALSAFVWRCITRVRDLPPHEVTDCSLPVNVRPFLNPPLSQDYFGVYLMRVKGYAKVGELLENNVGWAALLLHQALLCMNAEAAARAVFAQDFTEGPPLVYPSPGSHSNHVVVAGSPWFDAFGPEFGLGAAVATRTGFMNKRDAKVYFFAAPEGAGSVNLEICLAPDTMSALLADDEFMSLALEKDAGVNLVSRI